METMNMNINTTQKGKESGKYMDTNYFNDITQKKHKASKALRFYML